LKNARSAVSKSSERKRVLAQLARRSAARIAPGPHDAHLELEFDFVRGQTVDS
jgi:hypothetical protein